MNTPGYEKLAGVLLRAYEQAANGKGKERHAQGEPFHEQVMQIGARKFGTGALLFQAFKKSEESQRLPHDRAVAELLGSIVYLAGAVIAMEAAHEAEQLTVPIPESHPLPPYQHPLEPKPGWNRWSGWDFVPCSMDREVEVMTRDGAVLRGLAEKFNWIHHASKSDIVMWRAA